MKKLRFFDSLKLVLATVAFVFAIVSAHAAILPAEYTELEYLESTGTQWINTNVDERTIDYMELKFETVNDSSGFMFVNGASQVGVKDSRYGTSEPGVYIIKQNVLDTKWYFTNETNGTTYTNGRVGSAMLYLFNLNNNGVTNYKNKNVKIYYYKASKNDSLVFDGIPARRDSDGVLGMYDLADSNPATAFHTNAGTGEFVAGPDVISQIKIATTKYNEQQFAPVENDLDDAVAAVDTVVTQTMTQAQAIDTIATSKQTRPDEGCTAKYCLLVEDEDGTPHWYPIAGANGVAHALPVGYTELQYIGASSGQFINTGINPTDQMIIKTDILFVSDDISVFGGSQNNTNKMQVYKYLNKILVRFHNQTSSSLQPVISNNNWYSLKIDYSNSYGTINDTTTSITKTDAEQITYPIYIWANNVAGTISGGTGGSYIKFFEIRNGDGTNLFYGVPARRNSDNALGMYDMVSGQFFTNAGTGTFVAGPDM